jgi:hypothetical protein
MGKNMPNINPMSIVVYGCNQTSLVATNIKNRQIADFINTRKSLSEFIKGEKTEGRDEVFPDTYHKLQEGGTVEVESLAESPGTNRIPGESAKSSTYKDIGRSLLLAGVILLLIGFRKIRRERRYGLCVACHLI